jgi:gamma-glutamyltranspeptidase / glutathione hydrolase
VTSGLSVGVPGTPRLWADVLDRWGSQSLARLLTPSIGLASRGFVVDETFRQQTEGNAKRLADFPATRELFLPGGAAPVTGSRFRNPDLALIYSRLAAYGVDGLYDGPLAREIVSTVTEPPVDPDLARVVRPGVLTGTDLAAYTAPTRAPTRVGYRDYDVYGMAPPSSGGTTGSSPGSWWMKGPPRDPVVAL